MKKDIKFNTLTAEEERVIAKKGTEAPYTGTLLNEKREGTFVCKRCDAPLYYSDMKFHSGCGRPSFDDAIDGQVHEETDADGHRTEITCKNCGGHLGHVFRGEHMTDKNTRHCVNSVSMKFVPEKIDIIQHKIEQETNIATFGGGCYRCVEAVFQRLKGVLQIESGFMGGMIDDPTYELVCSGTSGHVEVIHIHFDPSIISYQTLLSVFFTSHDPTQLNRQGADTGTQYASVIFTHNKEQEALATETINQFNSTKVFAPHEVVTDVREASTFRKAPAYHQDYYNNNSEARYCSAVISPKIKHLRDQWQDLLKDEYIDEHVGYH